MDPRPYHEVSVGQESFYVDVRYQNLKPIGGGSYGFVCSAEDTATGERVAIKKIRRVFNDLVDAKRILREIKLLRHFQNHENIITVKDLITVPPNTIDFTDVYIITNLMESDLDRIISSRQPLTDQHFQYFLYQILRGLKYIHSASVLHRDLKPSNLLVNANCDLAICDFGLARGVDQQTQELLTEYVQTRWYRAPELLCDMANYDSQIDVWSVGCIFAEMLRRKPFFRGESPQHQLETIVSVIGLPGEDLMEKITDEPIRKALYSGAECKPYPFRSYFPRDTNPVALDLLQRMLVFDPRYRCTIDQALEHEYLADLHRQMEEPLCDTPFDFDFEKQADPGVDIPQADLQMFMFSEMQELLSQDGER
uniref:Mitogen-activated protein kinase n=1 Tax=Rhizochromulina marina TaxID=1034831 RepID=A0A6U1B509_9STRA|mmetsp:Transcript_29070/g.84882  ORF Transcript_29070/g.84882 Transcript_29070/m.84882 type:complete len:367 (+) Transcript_29070:177-1277(+)